MEREGVRERERERKRERERETNQWEGALNKGKAYDSAYRFAKLVMLLAMIHILVAEYVITVVTPLASI